MAYKNSVFAVFTFFDNIFKSFVFQEECDRLRQQQRKVESEKFAAKAAEMKKDLELEYDEKMRRMAQIVNSYS